MCARARARARACARACVRAAVRLGLCSSWFAKFKGFDDSTYPGGKGKETNGTFHVPTCDWYGTADKPPKCSGFYHVSGDDV